MWQSCMARPTGRATPTAGLRRTFRTTASCRGSSLGDRCRKSWRCALASVRSAPPARIWCGFGPISWRVVGRLGRLDAHGSAGLVDVEIRSGRPPAVDRRAHQPLPSAADRVDQGDAAIELAPRRLAARDRHHLPGTHREVDGQGVPVVPHESIGARRGKDQQPGHRSDRCPPEPARGLERGALIPAQLALDGPQVIEPRLDLDDDQDTGPRVEREKVDPAMRASMDDLHFPRGLGAVIPQSTLGLAEAPPVQIVNLVPGLEDARRAEVCLDDQPQRAGDALYHVEGRVRAS